MNHEHFICECLRLAEQGRGRTGINPMVGSVLVRRGSVVVSSYYKKYGDIHSERALLQNYDQEIYSDDMLYVNLEPCVHTGLTRPCTEILLERGIKNVVFGMVDPDLRVSGAGIEFLRSNGVNVVGPVLRTECEYFNRGFISLRTKRRPWIALKRAQTLAGKVTKPDGAFLKITSNEQDQWSHAFLRAKHDAILVGIGTALADDPELTVRLNKKFIQPWKIVLDPLLRTPPTARVLNDRLMIITSPVLLQSKDAEKIRDAGSQIFGIPVENGIFPWGDLWKILTTPTESFFGIASILVEGGAKTWKIFKKAGMVDEEIILVGE